MGLFDRFRRKIVEAEEESGITSEEGSAEAERAIAFREKAKRDATEKREEFTPHAEQSPPIWEEADEEIEDPFSKPISSRERKLAARAKASPDLSLIHI